MKMKKLKITKMEMIWYILIMAIVLIGDQVTKVLVAKNLQIHTSQTIINGLLYFLYLENKGAAWGILEGKIFFFLLVALVAAIAMIVYFIKVSSEEIVTRYGLVLVFSGMIGNAIDRLFLGYVRDFIGVIIFNYHFPIFNIADMAVVIGVGLIILESIIGEYYGKYKKI